MTVSFARAQQAHDIGFLYLHTARAGCNRENSVAGLAVGGLDALIFTDTHTRPAGMVKLKIYKVFFGHEKRPMDYGYCRS